MTSLPKRKKLPLSQLEEAARDATHIALQFRPRIKSPEHLTLGIGQDGDCMVFELYLAKDRPKDAVVLTETRVNVYDGRVESVRVFDSALAAIAAEQLES